MPTFQHQTSLKPPSPSTISPEKATKSSTASIARGLGYHAGASALAPKAAASGAKASGADASAAPQTPAITWTPAPTVDDIAAGAVMHEGQEGPPVTAIQELLKCRVTGQFDAATQDAVHDFQLINGVGTPSGKVGGTTLKALRKKGTVKGKEASHRADIIEVARKELGHKEKGENGGEALKYQRFFKRGPEQWCADFVSWVYTHAGQKMNQSSVTAIARQLEASKRWKTSGPVPGDMVIFDWDGDGSGDHIGIVEKINKDGTIKTIEGNTPNPKTGKEGVWEKTRSKGVILGYGRP